MISGPKLRFRRNESANPARVSSANPWKIRSRTPSYRSNTLNPAAAPTAAKSGKQHGAAIAATKAPAEPIRSREEDNRGKFIFPRTDNAFLPRSYSVALPGLFAAKELWL